MISFLTLLFSLVGLGVLIIIHELGHLIAAKMVGMRVEAFGIGFGKPIFTFKVSDVTVHISWIPFGGYVKIAGMDELKDNKKSTDGFFSRPPLARMLVAFAGPLANILFCLFAFGLVWIGGGRTKPFSFATDRIGLLDSASPLLTHQVRSGDRVISYDLVPVAASKDHFTSAMTAVGPVSIETESLLTKEKKVFSCSSYSLASHPDMKTFGILAPAAFVVWAPSKEQTFHEQTSFLPGDRLLWANGENIFSFQKLKEILNKDNVFLTVRRGSKVLHLSLPRCSMSDVKLSQEVRGELTDWMFEGKIDNTKISSLFFLPYNFSQECVVEAPLEFLASHTNGFSSSELIPGDKVIAVWGIPVTKTYEILRFVQKPHAVILVERGFSPCRNVSLQELDQLFVQPYRSADFSFLIQNIGLASAEPSSSSLKLLTYVPLFTKEELVKDTTAEKGSEESKNLYLGLAGIQDVTARYNPSPKEAVVSLFEEITSTFHALFSGSLSPKLMSGPVGIVQLIQQQWAYGFFDVLFWLGAISFNLALINLLPLPVLDGGYICMSLIELCTFRKISPRISEKLIAPFAFLLIGLLLYLTYHDLIRIFSSFR